MASSILMKANHYYAGGLTMTLLLFLVIVGPFASATTMDQSPEIMNQTQTTENGIVTVAVGEGSNATVQYYTYTPQSLEINLGESVTWFSPAELADIHTVTFVQDQNIMSDILLPFAVPPDVGDFELLPPFNAGEPVLIDTPDNREAIVALNKHAFYPTILDESNQTTFLEGTEIQTTMNSTVRVINSGIILPPMPTFDGPEANDTLTNTTGQEEQVAEPSIMNETTTTTANVTNTTPDVMTLPNGEEVSPTAEDTGEQLIGPPFPIVSSFTVAFEEPGTYPYFCAIHPWQTGEVIVRGENQTGPQTQDLAETQVQEEPEELSPIFQ
jgi:plastocyanin